jgi:hypothetical protein
MGFYYAEGDIRNFSQRQCSEKQVIIRVNICQIEFIFVLLTLLSFWSLPESSHH